MHRECFASIAAEAASNCTILLGHAGTCVAAHDLHVRPWGLFFTALSTMFLTIACGRVMPALPTAPSPVSLSALPAPAPAQAFPSLTGRWRAAGTRIVYRNLETGATPGSYGCQGMLTIESQNGGAFNGKLNTDGNGWNSDRFCTGGGSLTGEILLPDGSAARARLDGGFSSNQCTFVSGGGEFTGIAHDAEIRLQRTDTMRCPVNMDGGPGMPLVDFERTVTLVLERW